jgi:hypothetical protein
MDRDPEGQAGEEGEDGDERSRAEPIHGDPF